MKKKVLVIILNLSLLLTGCGNTDSEGKTSEDGGSTSAKSSLSADEMFTERDMETNYDESTSASITLSGNTAQSDSDAVDISGSTVTITDEGTYILTGTLDDGMIVVAAEKTDKVRLVLNDVQIQCSTSSALYVKQADKVFVTLAADSTNTLTNGGEYVAVDDNNIDSVIFSKDDLTLNGFGSLAVEAGAGHGIVSKDDLVITGGTYQITSASHGISAQDSIRIADGNFTISSGKDGIHAENTEDTDLGYLYIAKGTFEITSETDGLSAGSILQVEDGSFTLTAGGGSENAEPHQEDGGFAPGNRGRMPEGDLDMADGNLEMPEMPDGDQKIPEMANGNQKIFEMPDGSQEMPEM
ncbi:MAG TPA: carbohydrate-binding domain-containing protein, partial [Candidatus Pelethocola excrementipullorum]|nr:carbohydrate-binding domain-containing protein [Candidatus Pelethocola excrementipullorum]